MSRRAEAALIGAALCVSISVACDAVHTARADAEPPSPTADYSASLRQGRELLRQNKPRDAVVALDSALKARPDDPVALSELGWALFLAGDLARAQKESERAAALSHDPKLRAASLYNLGRAAEAATNRTAALAAYRQSLKLRPSAEVHARLATLDPAVMALEQRTPYALAKLNYRSIDSFCAEVLKDGNPGDLCPRGFMKSWPFEEKLQLSSPAPAIGKVEIFHGYSKLASCYRSYVSFEKSKRLSIYELGECSDYLISDIETQDMGKGLTPAVAIWAIEQMSDRQTVTPSGDAPSYFSKSLFLCGVGRSSVPSCTFSFELERALNDPLTHGDSSAAPPKWEHKWHREFDQPGTVRVTPDGWWPSEERLLKQVGRHRILFP